MVYKAKKAAAAATFRQRRARAKPYPTRPVNDEIQSGKVRPEEQRLTEPDQNLMAGNSSVSEHRAMNISSAHQPRLRKAFRRKGHFPFFSLPLEVRNMVYGLLLVPVADRLTTIYWRYYITGLDCAGASTHAALLLTCRRAQREVEALLYAAEIHARGLDLADVCCCVALRAELRPVTTLRVRLRLGHDSLDETPGFGLLTRRFLQTLPLCRRLRLDLESEDWALADTAGFKQFTCDLRREGGVEVVLHRLDNGGAADDGAEGGGDVHDSRHDMTVDGRMWSQVGAVIAAGTAATVSNG